MVIKVLKKWKYGFSLTDFPETTFLWNFFSMRTILFFNWTFFISFWKLATTSDILLYATLTIWLGIYNNHMFYSISLYALKQWAKKSPKTLFLSLINFSGDCGYLIYITDWEKNKCSCNRNCHYYGSQFCIYNNGIISEFYRIIIYLFLQHVYYFIFGLCN